MSTSAVEITNLLYRYAEYMDGGDLERAAALFHHARLKVPGREHDLDASEILQVWRRQITLYPCGTPRTKHVITNPIIDIDENAGRATVRSCYTILQAAPGLPLQVIAAGRYHDAFERVGQTWRFSLRDYSLLELMGDLSAHLKGFALGQ
ncbi:nuclear transport factor 2 family protein [Pseudomonas sp. GD03860]|uniref:nuclear transport factor 2 family protein n=1 Tax=Pseudomonas TaxID=286 RepID=UPI0023640E54|nr:MULTISPECIES: nuclear transport factor 2 family protein [Pseudomonas]MDD2056862.1 nuclear transport factor 2 family protein [Pseudomonas putida]MDH0637938.1 nuclear transport factor 2 family protein [Pseudomonas sp. GD03860]